MKFSNNAKGLTMRLIGISVVALILGGCVSDAPNLNHEQKMGLGENKILLEAKSPELDWVSPIDIKYKKKNPQLFSKYEKAKKLIDAWSGQQNILLDADEILKGIIQIDPDFAPAYREYGRLYIMSGYIKTVGHVSSFEKGTLDPSEKSILHSINIEPDYADSYVLLGHLYTKKKLYSEAEEALKKAEDIGTKTPWLDLNWAELLNIQGNSEKALLRYKKVIEEKSSNKKAHARALSGVTKYYYFKSDFEKAKQSHIKHLEFEPENAWNWGNYSSFLLFWYGDVDGAVESGEKALDLMNYGMGRFTLACALYTKWAMLLEKGDGDANKYFERAYKLYPDLEKVISKVSKHSYTKIAAKQLYVYKRNLF